MKFHWINMIEMFRLSYKDIYIFVCVRNVSSMHTWSMNVADAFVNSHNLRCALHRMEINRFRLISTTAYWTRLNSICYFICDDDTDIFLLLLNRLLICSHFCPFRCTHNTHISLYKYRHTNHYERGIHFQRMDRKLLIHNFHQLLIDILYLSPRRE